MRLPGRQDAYNAPNMPRASAGGISPIRIFRTFSEAELYAVSTLGIVVVILVIE